MCDTKRGWDKSLKVLNTVHSKILGSSDRSSKIIFNDY